MKTPVDQTLREQVKVYRLRFTCEYCAHWNTSSSSCSHGYPSKPHEERPLATVNELLFCKDFELV